MIMISGMRRLSLKDEKGFSLMELMIVVVIIGIIIAIALPVYNNVTETAKNNAHQANIRVIEGAITAYLANTGGGSYSDVEMDKNGKITGDNITEGELVPDYLREMPENPLTSKKYTKAAGGNVMGEL